jgi:hypothetical protein
VPIFFDPVKACNNQDQPTIIESFIANWFSFAQINQKLLVAK